jgi:hypothetical protein
VCGSADDFEEVKYRSAVLVEAPLPASGFTGLFAGPHMGSAPLGAQLGPQQKLAPQAPAPLPGLNLLSQFLPSTTCVIVRLSVAMVLQIIEATVNGFELPFEFNSAKAKVCVTCESSASSGASDRTTCSG